MRRWFFIKGLLLLLSAATLFTCSCGSKDPGPAEEATLSVKPSSYKADFPACEFPLEVTASGDWGVSSDDKDWCTVSPSGGVKGTSTVTVKLATNRTGKERVTQLTFRYGNSQTLKVPVLQNFSEEDVPPEPGEIVVPEGYALDWNDEFDTPGVPDAAEWWYETGGGGWGNNEDQVYVGGSFNGEKLAYISDGTLKIEARKIGGTVYSIRMNTKKGWQYGWFEARLKVPDTPGSWPAFWMMPKNFTTWPGDGEIDIMEYAISTQGKDFSSSSIHCNAFNWPAGTQKTHKQYVANAASEFHVYALEWTPAEMIFYVDGKQHLQFKNDGGGYNHWPFDAPFYLKLNLAWGGNMGGKTDESALPAVYEVDYVRVFTKK